MKENRDKRELERSPGERSVGELMKEKIKALLAKLQTLLASSEMKDRWSCKATESGLDDCGELEIQRSNRTRDAVAKDGDRSSIKDIFLVLSWSEMVAVRRIMYENFVDIDLKDATNVGALNGDLKILVEDLRKIPRSVLFRLVVSPPFNRFLFSSKIASPNILFPSLSLKLDLTHDMSKIEYVGGVNYIFRVVHKAESSYITCEKKSPDYVQDPLQRLPRITLNSGSTFRPMVELFSVQIMNLNSSCNIFGTIRHVSGIQMQYLYNRKREESESIDPENPLLLIGPVQAISGYRDFGLLVDLTVMDKDKDLPLVTRGLMSWKFSKDPPGHLYNQPTSYEVDGDYGDDYASCYVRVNYMVIKHGVQATLTVMLIIGDGEDPSQVYGQITACNSTFSEGSLLFQKKSNEHIDVSPEQLIPLSRSVVAVPFDTFLIVRADLSISSDVIAEGMAKFRTEFTGTFQENICGKGKSEILVKVTWA
ncbi:hypothetical protein HHK36_019553 [Tetracentron sinense]|uniref:DUF6598 domain-containing protein n=1 Tax=Tetracentron sinense TaxID=13715 RepID=A0A834Z044_TETSI|nr:hypothetical protein HHK36_019553 [Tetracentron sinense]